jgi:hypothetical protein
MEANERWLDRHEAELLQQHPDWKGQWIAVAACTSAKVVGVAADRMAALEEGMRCKELIEAASRQQMHPGSMIALYLLGEDLLDI